MDRNANYRFGGAQDGLLVSLAPLYRAVQVVVPKELQQEKLNLEHERVHVGHPGGNKMCTSLRRAFYWQSMVADVHVFVLNCVACWKSKVRGKTRTSPLKLFHVPKPFTNV